MTQSRKKNTDRNMIVFTCIPLYDWVLCFVFFPVFSCCCCCPLAFRSRSAGGGRRTNIYIEHTRSLKKFRQSKNKEIVTNRIIYSIKVELFFRSAMHTIKQKIKTPNNQAIKQTYSHCDEHCKQCRIHFTIFFSSKRKISRLKIKLVEVFLELASEELFFYRA